MSETKTVVKQCVRCNGKTSKRWHKVNGYDIGLECVDHVETHKSLKGNAFVEAVRNDYKVIMRITSVTGGILNGNLQLSDMVKKEKITIEQFLSTAKKRYRGDEAKTIVNSLKDK